MNEIDLDLESDEDRVPEQILLDTPHRETSTAGAPDEPVGLAQWLTDQARATDSLTFEPAAIRPHRWRIAASGACVMVLAAVLLPLTLRGPGEASPGPVAPAGTVEVATETAAPQPPSRLVSGNAAGCVSSVGEAELVTAATGPRPLHAHGGAHAIALFEAAYYRARDGGKARQLLLDASVAVPDAAAIQAGIDSLPTGTTYCAHIAELAAGVYTVEIRETPPGEPESVWRQQISTSHGDGAVITHITALPSGWTDSTG
ncbi:MULTISPECIES: hypothetical protein [unclassified Nocardia]|uniref:hypothetical protein n=1 Tax=unclassified Nocardia TaxID=2637762 RepID=UPI00278C3EA5|nr:MULTISPECIES: hypothetical protein [unclassified Nocardia]